MAGKRRRKSRWSTRRLLAVFVASVAIAWSMLRWVVASAEVTSNSMSPALEGDEEKGGDLVLVDRLSYRWRGPERGEIVAFESDEGLLVMKRVVGLPEEEIAITREGRVLVDGEPHGVAAIDAVSYRPFGLTKTATVRVREGHYFVLGDFTSDSWDSRFWGGLAQKRIRGRAIWILWPPGRFGPIR